MTQSNQPGGWGVGEIGGVITALVALLGGLAAVLKARADGMKVSGEQRRADDESGLKMATEVIKILREEVSRKDADLEAERARSQGYFDEWQRCREQQARKA